MIARARAELRAARPTFREWEDSSAVELSLADAGPVAFTSRPVVGDFDEDGTPDMAFLGRDAQREQAVASSPAEAKTGVVEIASDKTIPASGPRHLRRMRLATVFTDHDQIGLDVVERDQRGEYPLPPSQYVYWKGNFQQWITGS